MIWIIFSVCLVLFIISFSILFRKQLKKTFKAIGNFFSDCSAKIKTKQFNKKRKKIEEGKVKRLTFSKTQTRPILLEPQQQELEAPKEEKPKEVTEVFKSKKVFKEEENLANQKQEIIALGEKYSKDNKKVDFNKLDEMIASYEKKQHTNKPNFQHIRTSNDDSSIRVVDNKMPMGMKAFNRNSFMHEANKPNDFLKSVEKDKEYSQILNENMKSLRDKINSNEYKTMESDNIMLDGVEIDLQKLPPNLRRLLLSGLLERPNFDDLN